RRLPFLDGITFTPVRDESVRVGALKAASIDVALDLGPASARPLRSDPNVMAARSPAFASLFLGFGVSAKPFDDPGVRRAVAMAIDRGAIVQGAYAGEARPATQLLPPGLLGYDDTITQFSPSDAALAKKALADAGYATGVATDLWYSPDATAALPDPKRVAEGIAADLAKIGVTATVRTEDAAAFAADARAGRLPLWLGARDPDRADPDDFMADATTDPSKRGELYKQVAKLVQQSVSRVPLLHAGRLAGLSRKVQGVVVQPVGPSDLGAAWFGS